MHIGRVLWFDDIFSGPSTTQSSCSPSKFVPIDLVMRAETETHSRKAVIINEGAGDSIALLGMIRSVQYLSQDHLLGKDRVVNLIVDSGTGTTAVGLGLGALCLGLPWKVTAVMLYDTVVGYKQQEKRLISDFKRHFGFNLIDKDGLNGITCGLVHWIERSSSRKFGNVLEGEVEACQKIAQRTGIF